MLMTDKRTVHLNHNGVRVRVMLPKAGTFHVLTGGKIVRYGPEDDCDEPETDR